MHAWGKTTAAAACALRHIAAMVCIPSHLDNNKLTLELVLKRKNKVSQQASMQRLQQAEIFYEVNLELKPVHSGKY